MKLKISPRASAKVEREDAWWREFRKDAPDKFKQAMQVAYGRILIAPLARKVWATVRGKEIRRIYEPATRYHVFYSVDEKAGLVVIENIHGGTQGSPPDFR